LAWDVLQQDYILRADEFSIHESASGFNIDIEGDDGRVAEVTIQPGAQWEMPLQWNAKREWNEDRIALWLEKEIRLQYLTQETLAIVALHNVQALVERGMSVAVLARFKFLLARRLKEKLAQLRIDAKVENYQRVLFDADGGAPMSRFRFEFSADGESYHYNYAYQGGYRFDKHYYGPIGDLKNAGEEYECAVALDSMAEVQYWIRNVDRKPNSFWLPLARNKFYPDFVAQLFDGRMLAVEYKGKHLVSAKEAKERNLIGELWQRESAGKALFVMPTQTRDAPPVRAQIERKLRQTA